MTHRFCAVTALAFCLVTAAFNVESSAQIVGRTGQPSSPTNRNQIIAEELPQGQGAPGFHAPHGIPEEYVGEGFGPNGHCSEGHYPEGGYPDEYSGGYYNPTNGCCDECGDYGSYGSECDILGCGMSSGQYFVFADYLHVRAHFSEAVGFVEREIQGAPQIATDRFRELDFEYDSSYRFGGGYRMANCGQEFRFMYTQLTSFADELAPDGSLLPFDPTPLDGEEAIIHSFVDVDSFDFDCRKTIPLGGRLGTECGDACHGDPYCGDPCGSDCPAWDITWSGGVRYAEVDWNRSYLVTDGATDTRDASSILNFEGGGPRIGIEGRRYWGQGGWFSVFAKGDLSLLFGDLKLITSRHTEAGTIGTQDDIFVVQSFRNEQLVPITEIEAGVTANVTCNSIVTAGYLFSAWHDLGFRDEFRFVTDLETQYDDANILGFDGFFARLELAY